MTSEQLIAFLKVAEKKSFTKAADALYLSHSTTSRNVAALESDLGVKLFHRTNQGITLTAAGELLYKEGLKINNRIEVVENAVIQTGLGIYGQISIDTPYYHSEKLNKIYGAFNKNYPNAAFSLRNTGARKLLFCVGEGAADIGFVFSHTLANYSEICKLSTFVFHKIASDHLCLVVSPDHMLTRRVNIKADDLKRFTFISPPFTGKSFLNKISDMFRHDSMSTEPREASTLEALFVQIKASNSVSLVPYSVVRCFQDYCAVVTLTDLDISFDVLLAYSKNNINPTMNLFKELLFYLAPECKAPVTDEQIEAYVNKGV